MYDVFRIRYFLNVGYAKKDLIMKSCRMDGLILKPSRPLTAINEDMVKHALPSAVPSKLNNAWIVAITVQVSRPISCIDI